MLLFKRIKNKLTLVYTKGLFTNSSIFYTTITTIGKYGNEKNFQKFKFDEYINEQSKQQIENYLDAKLPYSFDGQANFIPIMKEFDQLILKKNNEKYQNLMTNFKQIYLKFLQGVVSGQLEDLPELETNFLCQTLIAIKLLKNNEFELKLVEDKENFESANLKEELSILETTIVKGANIERGLNYPAELYTVDKKFQSQGLVVLIPPKIENEKEKLKANLIQRQMSNQVVLRLIAKFVSPFWLNIYKNNQNLIRDKHTFIHTCIFENQLRQPPPFTQEGLQLPQWIPKWRLTKKWVMTDFDNILNTNPLLNNEKNLRDNIVFRNNEIEALYIK